ncbi:MAG: succinate--CoA ligase subunit alpha [Corynebacterium sp.]|uniref:succinate--CoA ligase subunit alpha n=1 Tax=Corynebacterium sp. TaxID=1720 RepID=UPI0026DF1288|nr:succinate--CoA ligase subunit alpha [Corynebacterium sp.]MDO5669482.1 succinate--CoA ligase subunit alpha [Corynebacterium sp.]
MAVLIDADSRIIVQGITGREGRLHTERMLAAGARVVGGTNPKKAGETVTLGGDDLPVFATVADARETTDANVSVVFVPAAFVKDAVIEAIEAEMPLVVVITEGVPVRDTAEILTQASKSTRIIGPNCPGLITPGASLAGIIPAKITGSGPVGLISKSGTLTYQMMNELSDVGISTAIGIGGDPLIGTDFMDALELFESDPDTEAIVMIGEIGGDAEERAAEYITANVSKPVVAYIAGFTAPEGKTMGHAGAIVTGSVGTARAKKTALEAAGVRVGTTPTEAAEIMRRIAAERQQ